MYVSRTRQVRIPPNGTRQALLLKSDSLISTKCKYMVPSGFTLRNRKFLRQYVPVQTPPPKRTVNDDLRHISRPLFQPTTTPPSLPSAASTPAAQLPAPATSGPMAQATPPCLSHKTPAPEPTSPPPPVPPSSDVPASPLPTTASPTTPVTSSPAGQSPPKKPPPAVRRLLDYNKKGLLEL